MRVLFYSDVHYFVDKASLPGLPPRQETQRRTAEWVAETIQTLQPDMVVNGGDIKETHSHIDMASLDLLLSCENHITKVCHDMGIPRVVIAGNHDQASRDGSLTILPAMRKTKQTHLVEGVKVVEHDGFSLASIAHRYDLDETRKNLRKVKGADFVVVHQDILHADWIPEVRESDVGLSVDEVLDAAPYGAGGHFHHPQQLDERFAIIGSPCYYSWSDRPVDLPRGVMVWEDGKFGWVENPYTPIFATVSSFANAKKTVKRFDGRTIALKVKCQDEEDFEKASQSKGLRKRTAYLRIVKDYQDGIKKGAIPEEVRIVKAKGGRSEDLVESVVNTIPLPKEMDRKRILSIAKESMTIANQ